MNVPCINNNPIWDIIYLHNSDQIDTLASCGILYAFLKIVLLVSKDLLLKIKTIITIKNAVVSPSSVMTSYLHSNQLKLIKTLIYYSYKNSQNSHGLSNGY